jgi:NAD(P)-dependent dehydrogenase (short-subunit alcohol dehydrogenase family)
METDDTNQPLGGATDSRAVSTTNSGESRTWLITGAGGGLGQHLASTVLEAGGNVLATDLNYDALPFLTGGSPPGLRAMALDVTDPDAAHTAVQYALSSFGGLDVLVNAAGYRSVGSVEDMSDDEFRRNMETNLFGAVNMVRAVLPVLRPQRSGHIVNISSIGGRRAQAGLGAYQTSKWALGGFSEILAREVEPLGIHVTVVEPGGIRTPWAEAPISVENLREEYEPTVGAFLRTYGQNADVQRGDPARMAKAILAITEAAEPPVRLLLGSDAVWIAPQYAAARAAEDARWHDLSVSTDFPGLGDFSETEVARMVRPPHSRPEPPDEALLRTAHPEHERKGDT